MTTMAAELYSCTHKIQTMFATKSFFFLVQILLHLTLARTQPYCGQSGTYTSNSTYENNLNTLFSSLASKIDSNGFYNSSLGQNPDKVYSTVLCRGDLSISSCQDCINEFSPLILRQCSNNKDAMIFSDHCNIEYSDTSVSGKLTLEPVSLQPSSEIAPNPKAYNRELIALLESLKRVASNGGSIKKVAAGNRSVSEMQRIFAMEQCTPDLSVNDCSECLTAAINDVPEKAVIGARIMRLSCTVRFEEKIFYDSGFVQVPQEALPAEGKSDDRIRVVLIVVILPLVLLFILVIFFLRWRKRRKLKEGFKSIGENGLDESLQYDFDIIRTATDDFSDANKIGEGGFGAVYKGIFPNRMEIAVKRLSAHSGQGDLEFMNEVSLVAKLHHKNLVRLMGFCLQGSERLLVYEFAQNGSLDQFLFDPIKSCTFDWNMRHKIIGGIARGLLYLHEDSQLRIVHRDLKGGNVLLDEEMNPKIADFGMAKLFVHDEIQGNSRRVVGTYGYMPPEYAIHGIFSVKTDVFSFGMLVLEIISGQKSTGFVRDGNIEVLSSYAWRNWRQGTGEQVIDPVLRDNAHSVSENIVRCLQIGLLCVQERADERPTMAFVVLMLSSLSVSLPIPSLPAFFMGSFGRGNLTIEERNSESSQDQTINQVTMTEMQPR